MKLPDGNVLISFSGGRTSGYMLHRILEANRDLPDRVKVLFANTGREMPGTLDFVHNIEKNWGVDITWLEYSRAPSNRYQNHKRLLRKSLLKLALQNPDHSPLNLKSSKQEFLPVNRNYL